MRRGHIIMIAGLALLGACGKKADKTPVSADVPGDPQIVDIEGLPVDRSAEITGIDASTGDASGMPADGGKPIELPKPEAAVPPTVEAAPLVTPPPVAPTATTQPPVVTPPPPAAAIVPGGTN